MTAVISSPGRRAVRLTPIMNSPTGSVRTPSVPSELARRASSAASTGSPSPAGEQVARLPPMVAALRICGDPTVRAAWPSAGTSSASGGAGELGVGDAGADAQRAGGAVERPRPQLGDAVDDDHRLVTDDVPVGLVDLDHQVGATGEHDRVRAVAEHGHGVVHRARDHHGHPLHCTNCQTTAPGSRLGERTDLQPVQARPPAAGTPGRSRVRAWRRMCATVRLRTHLRSAGTTYHGASAVDVRAQRLAVGPHVLRPQRPVVEVARRNFQRSSGESMRSCKRCRCSSWRQVAGRS